MNTSESGLTCQIERVAAQDHDHEFLLQLYSSTRQDLHQSGLPQNEVDVLVAQQFSAQHQHYQTHFADAQFDIIRCDQEPVGRIYVAQNEHEIRLIDIAVLPEFRGQGIGGQLIDQLIHQARSAKLPIRLRVEPQSPATRLYERKGFRVIANEEINLHMEWNHQGGTQ